MGSKLHDHLAYPPRAMKAERDRALKGEQDEQNL
jgi:hypothetical protein